MKLTKGLFLAFAGLGLFACSNEDVVENGIQGEAEVAVKINLGEVSRALGTPTTGTTKAVQGEMEVIVATLKGNLTKKVNLTTHNPAEATWSNNTATVVFPNVDGPQSVEVKVNGYDGTAISTLAAVNPADGKWNDLKAPMHAKNSGVVEDGDDAAAEVGKIVRLADGNYQTNFTLEHKVGRLEFSGIKHVHETDVDCWFKPGIKLSQVSLWVSDQDVTVEPNFTATAFTENVAFPADGKCYAYNVVGGTLPELRLAFTGIEVTDEKLQGNFSWNEEGNGYAAIKQYKLAADASEELKTAFGVDADGKITKFPAGYVYTVTSLDVYDENIHETPDGQGKQLTAIIEVAPWTIVSGTAEWE